MRNSDWRKLDHQTLEALRLRAVEQMQAGAHPEDVAAVLGLHRTTVYGWRAQFRDGGRDALLAKPIPGRPPTLTDEQQARVYQWVVGSDPWQLHFEFALWTREMVRQLIAREFEVEMSPSAVGRLLHRLGLSPQRPLWRAWQADPEKVAAWKDTEYPSIAARAKKAGATVYFADEAGLRSDHHAGTTWGKVGYTPIIKTTGARHSLNMISAVTAKGKLRFTTFTGGFNAGTFIDFCKKLLHDADGPVFLIVDGHPAHKAKKVKAFVDSTAGRLELFVLPGYSPQLNPDEWVWRNVKSHRVGRAGITGPDQFRTLAVGALRRLQALPHIVRGFFHDPDLAYITAAQ